MSNYQLSNNEPLSPASVYWNSNLTYPVNPGGGEAGEPEPREAGACSQHSSAAQVSLRRRGVQQHGVLPLASPQGRDIYIYYDQIIHITSYAQCPKLLVTIFRNLVNLVTIFRNLVKYGR